jgi:acetyl-CoA C-acetyltransferase
MDVKERVPVLVGVGRYTQHASTPIDKALTPAGMFRRAALSAALDAGCDEVMLTDAVAIGCPAMFLEFRWLSAFGKMPFKNFPRTVANEIGANPSDDLCVLSWHGGNSPQFLLNTFAEMISKGGIPQGPILVGGVEENSAFDRAVRSGNKEVLEKNGWNDGVSPPKAAPKVVNRIKHDKKSLQVQLQQNKFIGSAITAYALFENAYAHRLGRNAEAHMPRVAELFAGFSLIAAAHPEHSWFTASKTKDFLLAQNDDNRMMSYPYRKWMCARDEIDQSACVIMMSWAEAERRGVHRNRLVFLHGSGDSHDSQLVPLRRSFAESPSMRAAYAEAFRSSGMDLDRAADVDKIACFDIYSCFPVAVEQACKCLGLDAVGETNSPSSVAVDRLTTTGGLPYHGGPGSNYSCHGLCGLVEKLRTPSFRGRLGMLCANGGILTEHACGVYSTQPPTTNSKIRGEGDEAVDLADVRVYARRPLSEYAVSAEGEGGLLVDGGVECFCTAPGEGVGRVITWTIEYGRKPNRPKRGIVIGEMLSGSDAGKRFITSTRPEDTATLEWLLRCDSRNSGPIGMEVALSNTNGEAYFSSPVESRL